MATTMDTLNETIQQLLTEKTLSLEALPHIQKLKDTVAAQEKEIDKLNKQISSSSSRIADLESKLHTVTEDRDALKRAETALAAREARVFALEKDAAVAQAQRDAYRDSMSIVFAPNAVRQRVLAYGGSTMPNGQYATNNEDSERTVIEGYHQPKTAGQVMTDKQGNQTTL